MALNNFRTLFRFYVKVASTTRFKKNIMFRKDFRTVRKCTKKSNFLVTFSKELLYYHESKILSSSILMANGII